MARLPQVSHRLIRNPQIRYRNEEASNGPSWRFPKAICTKGSDIFVSADNPTPEDDNRTAVEHESDSANELVSEIIRSSRGF
jgi:hypothetical protein